MKKDVKSKVAACDGRLMVKILITTIQVNLVPLGRLMVKILIMTIQVDLVPLGQLAQNSPKLSLLKFLPLTYHHSHFLAAILEFTSFFTIAFSRAALLFLQLGCI